MGADNTFGETNFNPNPPAEGAKKVQWSGYGELGNISQKPLQPTAEGAEKLKEMEELFNLEQQLDIPMKDRLHNSAKGKELFAAIQNKPHSTAEDAEEILRKNCNTCYSRSTGEEEVWSSVGSVLIAMQEFATLHAQKIADKMVEERLREELIKYEIHWNFVLRDNAEKVVDEYLKSREK